MRGSYIFHGLVFSILFISCVEKNNQGDDIRIVENYLRETQNQDDISVSLLNEENFQSLRTGYQGKILFVNVWATWCLPCKEEFPDLVKLADTYHDTDVAIIGLSVDYPDEIENKVKPFLRAQNAEFPNYVQNFKRAEDLINLFNRQWRGAVPATFIYDKQGKQQDFLLGKHTFEEFKAKIEALRLSG
jgi:thiol-disulfide isomerase/thioredoxin